MSRLRVFLFFAVIVPVATLFAVVCTAGMVHLLQNFEQYAAGLAGLGLGQGWATVLLSVLTLGLFFLGIAGLSLGIYRAWLVMFSRYGEPVP